MQQLKEVGYSNGFNPARLNKDYYHTEEIMDLCPIPEMNMIASASFDKKIGLWRMDTLQPKAPLLGHKKGVYSLDWCPDHNVILSAGLDHDVFLWNPVVNKWIMLLKGHNHSLVGVKWVPGTN